MDYWNCHTKVKLDRPLQVVNGVTLELDWVGSPVAANDLVTAIEAREESQLFNLRNFTRDGEPFGMPQLVVALGCSNSTDPRSMIKFTQHLRKVFAMERGAAELVLPPSRGHDDYGSQVTAVVWIEINTGRDLYVVSLRYKLSNKF